MSDMVPKKRQDLSCHAGILQRYRDQGMRTATEKALIEQCAQETGLNVRTVKTWIHNQNCKSRTNDNPRPRKKAVSLHPRKQSARTLFFQRHMASDACTDPQKKFSAAQEAYGKLTKEDKEGLQQEAKLVPVPQKQPSASVIYAEIERLMKQLEEQGEETLLLGVNTAGILQFGSIKGQAFLKTHVNFAREFYIFTTASQDEMFPIDWEL